MEKRKRLVQVGVILGVVYAMCMLIGVSKHRYVQIEDNNIPLSGSTGVLIEYTEDDINVIPDKYNTGAQGELKKVTLGDKVNGIQLIAGNNATTNVFDFATRNNTFSGTIIISDFDFSDYPITIYNEAQLTRNIKLVFNNCKFSIVTTGKEEYQISYEFNNCTINSFVGSNAEFNNCLFGRYFKDGIVPFQNVAVNNCYFCDLTSAVYTSGELHSDGTQIYGAAGIDVANVSYKNCRFEVPSLENSNSTARVNACIMLQLEYSNAHDVSFEKCIVNGGGYSIYAWDVNKGYTFENVLFDDISVGCARKISPFFNVINPSVKMNNINETNSLYVGSVWKAEDGLHISVTNDTNQIREITVFTDKGEYKYTIPACPNGSQLSMYGSFDEMPFDLDVAVPGDCKYAVCYDTTLFGAYKQIRFVNWSDKKVYLDSNLLSNTVSDEEVISSGMCGKNISYKLSSEGVLTLEGTGNTYAYNSKKQAPWIDYAYMIEEVVVGEGIEVLGTQLFMNCTAIKEVALPETLIRIDGRAFMRCSCLLSLKLPSSIEEIGGYGFYGAMLQEVIYNGNSEEWNQVVVGDNNADIQSKIICVGKGMEEVDNDSVKEEASIVLEGICGKNINFVLTSDGILRLFGEGKTNNYNSSKVAPWFEYKDEINTVIIGEGISELGTQLFRMCSNLKEVKLPDSLEVIGGNVFIQCTSLNNITIPNNVVSIGGYAFAATNIYKTDFLGSEEEWKKINIAAKNDCIYKNVFFSKK